jgi:general secretion pathway protein F
MIRAGEGSGGLDAVLAKIADHAEANARLQSRLRAALTYPTIMTLVGGGVVSFLLAYVVPQITRVFLEANQTLPLPTRLLMGLSGLVAGYALYGLAGLAALVLGLRYWSRTETGARRLERVVFALPWVGTVVRNVAMARFAHTLSTMVSGGMPLVDALEISRSVTGSALLGDVLDEAKTAVSEGESLAGHLESSALFNAMVVDMIAVGERSGDLEKMLGKAAEALDEEVRGNVETMAGVLEPLMILVMAGIVLFVVLAVLLPVFEMNQLVR